MINKNIKEFRRKRGLTQKQLADLLGVSQNAVYNWENGKRQPKLDTLRKISQALGVPVTELINVPDPDGMLARYSLRDRIQDTLLSIGYLVFYDENDAFLAINFPDGYLEITASDLDDLADTAASYLEFKVQELRRKNPQDFRYRKKSMDQKPDSVVLMPNAAHKRTDIEATDEMKKHDEDIMDNDDF